MRAWTKWPAFRAAARGGRRPRPALRSHRLGAAEILYVGTCNRIEVVFATDGRRRGRGRAARGLPGPRRARTRRPAKPHACCAPGPERPPSSTCSCSPAAWIRHRPASRRSPRSCAAPGRRRASPHLRPGARSSDGRSARHGAPRAAPVRRACARPRSGISPRERVLRHLDGRQHPVALVGVSPMTRRCATCGCGRHGATPHRQPHAAGRRGARRRGGRRSACRSSASAGAPPALAAVVLRRRRRGTGAR